MRTNRIAVVLAVCEVLLASSCGPQAPTEEDQTGTLSQGITSVAGSYTANGTWISHAYVSTSSFIDANTSTLLQKMSTSYDVNALYVNVGTLDSTGRIQAGTYAYVVRFLNAVATYEAANGVTFKVYASFSGNLDPAVANYIDISTATGNVRSTIIDEAKRFSSTTVSGSYLTGATRVFDGVMLDFEPSGPRDAATDDTNFNNWKTLMQDMRTSFNAAGLGSRELGVAAHRYGDGSRWMWPTRYFYYMAKYVNVLAVMTYNSGSTSGTAYQSWIQSNATSALRGVSGAAYSDGNHPPPTNNPRVYFGFPAYAANSVHDPAYENTKYAAWGLDAAITALVNDTSDSSETYMAGAYMYLHVDGNSAANTYARWDTDWYWFYTYWLGK